MTWIFEDSGAILLEYYVDSSAKVVHYLNRSSPLLSAKAVFRRLGFSHLGTLANVTSAFMPTAPARLLASLQVLHSFACSTLLQIPTDSLDPAHIWPATRDILSESRSGLRTFKGKRSRSAVRSCSAPRT